MRIKLSLFLFGVLLSNVVFSQNEMKLNIYFNTDKYVITHSEKENFNTFLSKLDSVNVDRITILGFCDDRGSIAYNLSLSKKRANAVKDFFVNNEVSETLITVIDGKGELKLNATKNNIKSIRENNRRVEIIIKTRKEKEKDSLETPTTQTILRSEIKIGDKIRLKNIYFKSSYSTIVPESIPTLKEIAAILAERDDVYFTIQGHVCCTHDTYDAIDRNTNKRNLSVSRARFIYNFFAKKGVDKSRMKFMGLRRKFPLGGDPRLDRRVEILITHISNKK